MAENKKTKKNISKKNKKSPVKKGKVGGAKKRRPASAKTVSASYETSLVGKLVNGFFKNGKKVFLYLKNILDHGDVIPVTGIGFSYGVAMRSDHYIAVSTPSLYGNADVITARIDRDSLQDMPLMKYPIMRGIGQLVESIAILSFIGWHIRRVKAIDRQTRRVIDRVTDRGQGFFRGVVLFLLAVGFMQYIFLQFDVYGLSNFGNFVSTIIGILIFATLVALVLSMPSGDIEFLAYQRAQHAILYMYSRGEKMTVDKLRYLEKAYDRPALALVLYTVVIFSFLLTSLNLYTANIIVAVFLTLGLMAISYALAYEFVHALVRREGSIWFAVFIIPITAMQQIIFHQPEIRHLHVGLAALEEVVRLEKQYRS